MSWKLYNFLNETGELIDESSGQFTGGFYTKTYKLDGVTYEIGLAMNHPDYCELISVNGRQL